MRPYRFRALVMLDPAALEGSAHYDPGGPQACCLVEPSFRTYFPAMISVDSQGPPRATAHALVTVALQESEAGAFFAPGQRFTIWADAVVGHSVQAVGLSGYGVIAQRVSPAARRLRGRPAETAA